MIGYSGYFGAGKTLNMTKDLWSAHKKGAFIITNYTTTFSHLIVKSQEELLTVFQEILAMREQGKFISDVLPDFPKNMKDIYIGVDEAGVYFNARNFKEWSNFPSIMDFLLQCRKLRVEIFYSVQAVPYVDVNFRRITTEWRVFKRMPLLPLVSVQEMIIPPDASKFEDGQVMTSSIKWAGKSDVYDMYDTSELCFKVSEDRSNVPFGVLHKAELNPERVLVKSDSKYNTKNDSPALPSSDGLADANGTGY